MDIYRALRYVMVWLIILNMLLVASIAEERMSSGAGFSKESMQNLEQLMKQNNTISNQKLSGKGMRVNILEGSYELPPEESLESIYENYSDVAKVGQTMLKIKTAASIVPFDKKNAVKYTQSFIEKNIKFADYELCRCTEFDGGIKIVYHMLENGRFVDESFLKFKLYKNSNVEAEIAYLDTKPKQAKVEVISPAGAALSALPELKNTTISSLKLGYKSDASEDMLANRTVTITLFPYYSINTTDGRQIYVKGIRN